MTSIRLTLTLMATLGATAVAPALAHAQQPQPQGTTNGSAPAAATTAAAAAPTAPVNPAAELAIKQMTAKLRTVLAAQEHHYSDHGTYTTSMTALGRIESSLALPKPTTATIVRRDSVSVQIIFAGGRGWTGIASHWGLRGRSCVVYVGMPEELPKLPMTRADRRTPTEEGVPACDSAPPPSPAPGAPTTPAAPAAPAAAPQPAPPRG
jgi:pyruvate dehydrogenase E2 component (dihydrolipoamide acetyltransferase)